MDRTQRERLISSFCFLSLIVLHQQRCRNCAWSTTRSNVALWWNHRTESKENLQCWKGLVTLPLHSIGWSRRWQKHVDNQELFDGNRFHWCVSSNLRNDRNIPKLVVVARLEEFRRCRFSFFEHCSKVIKKKTHWKKIKPWLKRTIRQRQESYLVVEPFPKEMAEV